MTRRSKRGLARRVDDLADRRRRRGRGSGGPEETYVLAIGGDPDTPRGWVTREEFEEHYGPWSERAGIRMVNDGSDNTDADDHDDDGEAGRQ